MLDALFWSAAPTTRLPVVVRDATDREAELMPVTWPTGRLRDDRVFIVLLEVAVMFAAVPVVFWLRVGTSAATIADRDADVPLERRYFPED